MAQLLAQRLTRFNCLKYVCTLCSIKIHFSNVLNQTSGGGGWRDSLPVWLVSSRNDGLHCEAILALFTVSFVLNFASSDLNEQQFSPTQS